jgi:pimeloyl-ACP methyl ester carboxylesterase
LTEHQTLVEHSLILIPGLLCDAAVWAPQAAALADLAEIRIADHGVLDSLGAMAEAIIAQAPPRFAVAGHSMGGRVALEVVRRAGARVTGLALLDTGYLPLPHAEAGRKETAERQALLDIARREGMRAVGRRWLRIPMVHPDRLADRALVDGILDMFERKTPDQFEAQVRALLQRPDASALLPGIACPTLVLCGEDDAWSLLQAHRDMAALIRHSTLVSIPECGHMAMLERPGAVNDALRAWLQTVRVQSRGAGWGRAAAR